MVFFGFFYSIFEKYSLQTSALPHRSSSMSALPTLTLTRIQNLNANILTLTMRCDVLVKHAALIKVGARFIILLVVETVQVKYDMNLYTV